MVATGELSGVTTVVRGDDTELRLCYRASETTIAGLLYYVSVSWPES